MNQFSNQDSNMEYYANVSTQQMEIIAIEDEAATMDMMLAAGGADNQYGFYDNNNSFIDLSTQQHYDQNINLNSAEAPTWHDCYPRGSQVEELASFPPYRPIDHFIAAADPKPPKLSYIPEPLPRITSVSEPGETSAGGTLISLVSSSGQQVHQLSSECGTSYGGGPEARGNGNYRARRNMT